ncbi:MAG: HEPN domain-containing protein [Chitinivibrionales bacterium]|nr:HEPN domain-containing protein [Chitinivibrionales bacterium]
MKEYNGDIIQYRRERAWEALDEAELMAKTDHWNTCVNRLYYACFYIVSALLEKNGYSSSKDTGIRSLFNVHFVKSGLISKNLAAIYSDLFERRQESDYGDFFTFEKADVVPWIEDTKRFVAELDRHFETGTVE